MTSLEQDLDVVAARCRRARARQTGGDLIGALPQAPGDALEALAGDPVERAVLAVVTAPILRADCASLLGELGAGGAIDPATIALVLDGVVDRAGLERALISLTAAGLVARRAAGAVVAGPAALDALAV